MNTKHAPPPVRVLGQRSIPSTFLFRSSKHNPSTDCECKGDVKIKASTKQSRVSLSDFLNRKLHRSSVLPNSAQGKERPFLSPVDNKDVNGSNEGHNGVKKRGEAEVKSVLDVVFEELKCIKKENDNCFGSSAEGEDGCSSRDDMQESKKRKNPFTDGIQSARKQLVVLGEDHPNPTHSINKQQGKEQNIMTSRKPRPLYNHYANGCGWWDCNREGVDNEEVGCNEVWEGIGFATLGGLDWH